MIFCVEDDDSIRDLMLYTLNMAGFETAGFAESTAFWEALKKIRPELIMLDIMLPGEDGVAILRKLRSSPVTADIPVIMATAKSSEYDKVTGLDLGADDYLAKPFHTAELLARVKSVLRRSRSGGDMPVVSGNVSLDPESRRVSEAGRELSMQKKEYDILI